MEGLLNSVLGSLMNDEVTGQVANKLGLEKTQAQSALTTALPILMQALNKNAATTEGANALESALQKHQGGLGNVTELLTDSTASEGGKILNHILGEKRNSVEKFVGEKSGISSGMVGNLLSMVAPLLMKSLAGNQGGIGGGITSLLGGVVGEMKQSGDSKGQSFIESLLDRDNDGSVLDDVADMGMSFLGKTFKK